MIDNQPQALPTATLVKPSATEIEFRNSEAEAPAEIKPEQTTPSDPVDAPSPEVPPIDAAAAVADEQPQALSNTALAEPPAGEPVFQDTENDPRAIIDFVIRKRSRQTGNQ
jgi:hypothetical protein